MIVLHTPRLFLRNFIPEDLEVLYDYRNNEGCARYQHWENTSKEYLREWIERYAQSAFLSKEPEQHYAISLTQGQLIGDLSFFYNEADPCITLGYTISYRQKAYPQTDIVALVEKENVPSIALLQKCGFVEEGFSEKINSCIFVKPPVGPSAPNRKETHP